MTDETTTEQLAEIEGQGESTPATKYTPPEGWRVVRFGESLQPGDVWVNQDGTERRSAILHWDAAAVSGGRCIRRIKPQPQPEAEPEPEPVQVRAGQWRTRSGEVKNIRPCEPLKGAYYVWPWTDGFMTFQDNGLHQGSKESDNDLVEYLGPIEPDKTQELPDKTQELETKTQELPEYTPPEGWRVLAVGERLRDGDVTVRRDGYQYPTERVGGWVGSNQRYIRPIETQPEPQPESDTELQAQVAFLKGREVTLGTRLQQEKQVTTGLSEQLETVKARINDLETINEAQEKALTAAGRDNTALRNQLGTERRKVSELEELVASLRTINRGCENAVRDAGKENFALQNQLAAVKAELTNVAADRYRLQIELDAAQQVPPAIADRFKEGWNQGTARAVETVLEWLQPIRAVDHPNLANETLQHLPQIMRHLTGLDSHAID